MRNRLRILRRLAVPTLGLALAAFSGSSVPGQQALPGQQDKPGVPALPQPRLLPQSQDGIEVESRGPVHEAFAQPFDKNVTPSPVVPKKPPAPVPEEPPEQRPAVGKGQSVE